MDFMEEKNRSLVSIQTVYELRLKQLRMELDKKCRKLAITENKLRGISMLINITPDIHWSF